MEMVTKSDHRTDRSPDSAEQNLQTPEDEQDERTELKTLLEDLSLENYYNEKLSLSKILEIDERNDLVESKFDIPLYFLKKLMTVNVAARNVKVLSNCDDVTVKTEIDFDNLYESSMTCDSLNLLDLITAIFLCSDSFLQQSIALKLSMCQFSIPLLLPNCDTKQCTLMLWALRDIVKQYRPQQMSESKGFVEERIVHAEVPMISFVRLGDVSMSKSELLNELLSSSQQTCDTFVHKNMECGESPKKISHGLVDITWYLPCGIKNMDVFVEPVALANLHGDIHTFETQFSFLCQTSAAVFVMFDSLSPGCELLTNQTHKAHICLIGSGENKSQKNTKALKDVATKLKLNPNDVIIKSKERNNRNFVEKIKKTVSDLVKRSTIRMSIEQMADIAHELGVFVDEDSPECKAGKQNADHITANIQNIQKFKETELPLQGNIWKELTRLQKEEFRLRKAGSQNIEQYKNELNLQKQEMRKNQISYGLSMAMTNFIQAISSQKTERSYFLKWMQINLDNISRTQLSQFREMYKKKGNNSENIEEIKKIDAQLSNSSLGIEHFFREMGQLYEASLSLPETDPYRVQFQGLPELCAQLLLDGFPFEIVDGDASNIPLRWVSDVFSKLSSLVSPNNKIKVVTVLGVQGSGKSTLMNTMFGVQFAVSAGRCTRGAFMMLIKVNENVRECFNCDFMVIVDTEGLKSPELAQLDNSHEHDNELATLVVGLSDITIINIAMENSTEMKNILQIVVHAFLRMKEVGKKVKCQFVHQNVADVSANEKNFRDRKLLLQQLNEMTQAAARMEKKEKNKSFTDVMEYNPRTANCYIPGLWNGNPPMAPINAGYSVAVDDLRKHIIDQLRERASDINIMEFMGWLESLWNAIKHETFIFSFRNSLVAEAYMKLCTEYNKWEWEFKKEMDTWLINAKTKICNFGLFTGRSEAMDIADFLAQLKREAASCSSKWEAKIQHNLSEYFKQTEGHVHLVEGYREEFSNSAKSLRRETESSLNSQLVAEADIRQGMREVDEINKNHRKEIEKAVCELLDQCRKTKVQMTDNELEEKFDLMWSRTLKKLSFTGLKPKDVYNRVVYWLRTNLSHKGSHAQQLMDGQRLKECGFEDFKCKAENLIGKFKQWANGKELIKQQQQIADSIIASCKDFVAEKQKRNTDYHETYIQEILHMIDEALDQNTDLTSDIKFEIHLKQHICGFAAKTFEEMNLQFQQTNDPRKCLDQNRDKFREDFKDVFNERDQCRKKAEEFMDKCLKPAVEDYVRDRLCQDIIGEMLTSQWFSTRMSFQYSLLKDLLESENPDNVLEYCSSYEKFVKAKILQLLREHFSDNSATFKFEDRHLEACINSINDAIKHTKPQEKGNMKTLLEDFCNELGDKLVLPRDALDAFVMLNMADQRQFAQEVTKSVGEMAETLRKKFSDTSFETKLQCLHVNPMNELFNRVHGCGKQCPFCGVPCEAGAKNHTQHFSSLHRPQGLHGYCLVDARSLVTDICTSLINSNKKFCSNETNREFHCYKNYREIFPDWDILPDSTVESSNYWKYMMNKYNNFFALEHSTDPANIPETWKKVTIEEANRSLEEAFMMTTKQTSTQLVPFQGRK